MSTLSSAAAPTGSRGFVAKAGTVAVGTVFAGSALLGGTAVAPALATGLTASVQHDVMLAADSFPTFQESLQTLLDVLGYGNMGQVLALFGTEANPISAASELSALLTALNPDNVSLDDVTLGMFSTDISGLLANVMIAGPDGSPVALGSVPIDTLIGSFIGGAGANESVGDVLTALGLGPYVGLLDLPMFGLSPNDTVGSLLADFLGITSTATLNDLVIGNGETLGDATIGGLLGITSQQLAAGWDDFLDAMTVGGTIMDPDGTGTLGEETLGALLTNLLGVGADPVTDATTLTDFLDALGLFGMLGLG